MLTINTAVALLQFTDYNSLQRLEVIKKMSAIAIAATTIENVFELREVDAGVPLQTHLAQHLLDVVLAAAQQALDVGAGDVVLVAGDDR